MEGPLRPYVPPILYHWSVPSAVLASCVLKIVRIGYIIAITAKTTEVGYIAVFFMAVGV